MAEIVPPEGMMCATCHAVLTPTARFTADGSDLLSVRYHHPAGFATDHDPVPVPTRLSEAKEICDFCSALEVAGYALATPFSVEILPGVTGWDDGQWSCCSTCRALLETGQYDALTARSMLVMADKAGPGAALRTRLLHLAFFAAFTGEIGDEPF